MPAVEPVSLPYLPHRTERLLLRLPLPADADAVQVYVAEPDVALMTANIPHPYPEGGAADFIAKVQADMAAGHRLVCAIVPDGSDAPIGMIGLDIDGLAGEADLGFWIGKPHWGRGYASEAAGALVEIGFREIGLRRIKSRALARNRASIRVQARIGLQPVRTCEGLFRPGCPPALQEERALSREGWLAGQSGHLPQVVLVSAVALVDVDGRVLIARRPEGKPMAGLWEFPGGKVHDGETPEAALIRELHEELGIDTQASCLAPLTFASHAYDSFHLLMPVFACRRWSGTPMPREGQTLKWVRPRDLKDYPMPPADVPLIAMLRDML